MTNEKWTSEQLKKQAERTKSDAKLLSIEKRYYDDSHEDKDAERSQDELAKYVQDPGVQEPRLDVKYNSIKSIKEEKKIHDTDALRKEGPKLIAKILETITDDEIQNLKIETTVEENGQFKLKDYVVLTVSGEFEGKEVVFVSRWWANFQKRFGAGIPTADKNEVKYRFADVSAYVDGVQLGDGRFKSEETKPYDIDHILDQKKIDKIIERKEDLEGRKLFNDPTDKSPYSYKS